MEHFETIVVGGGIMGACAAYHLARRAGGRARATLLLERFDIEANDRGSSKGDTRITRLTYHAATYVRLAREAFALWEELEREADEVLFRRTGDLFFGPEGGALAGYEAVLAAERVPFERLAAPALAARFPQFRLGPGERAIFQEAGGVLAARRCLLAALAAARRRGAEARGGAAVRAIDRAGARIRLETERGEFSCERLVLAGGPWMAKLAPELALPLTVTRQEVCYVAPREADIFRADRFPVWVKVGARGGLGTADEISWYGLPIAARFAIKLARFAGTGAGVDPDAYDGEVGAAGVAEVRDFLARTIPAAADGALLEAHTCLFTMTPDEDFVIDLHPADPRIALAAGFSGHGFKFGVAVGKALAELVAEGRTSVRAIAEDRRRFSALRFARA
jgi:sarcosine oxidase